MSDTDIYNKQDLMTYTTWEEKSGLIKFLGNVVKEVQKFNDTFGFNIHSIASPPNEIDGSGELSLRVGFVLARKNSLLSDTSYCLYSILYEKELRGYIGLYKDGSVKTVKELPPMKRFEEKSYALYDWMRELVKASCEKYI